MDGYLTIGTDIDTKNFDAEIKYIEQQMQEIEFKLKNADMGFDVGDTAKLEAKYEKLNRTITNLKQKQADTMSGGNWNNIRSNIDNTGESITKTIGKMGKWALAVFAVESAYGGIRRIISTVQQYDDKINANIQYMTYVVSNALKPVVEWIVNGVYRLLVYVNMVAKAWFNVDLFAKSTSKNFTDAQKKAENLGKTMAGFDTAQVLNDNSTSGASNTSIPNLPNPDDIPVPSWLKWIMENKDTILSVLTTIGVIIGGYKLLEFLSGLSNIQKVLELLNRGLGFIFGNFTLIKGLGIGLILTGVILLIKGIVDFIKDPSWNNFLTILQGIALIIAGIAVLMGGWVVAIVAVGVAIVAWIIQNWDKVKEVLGVVGGWIYDNIIKPVIDFFAYMGGQIWKLIKEPIDNIKNFIMGIVDSVKMVWKGIQQILNGDVKGGLQTIFKGLVNIIIDALNFLIGGLNAVISPIRLLVVAVGKVMGKNWTMDNIKIPKITKLKHGGIIDVPKTGVPLASNVIGGEAGAEGVLPLENPETMARLGREIGQWITLNVDLTNEMDGKTVSRHQEKLQNKQGFVRNGG